MMQRKNPWISPLFCRLCCLLLALAVVSCQPGASDPDNGNNDNNGTNPDPISDFSDYVFEEPEVTGQTFYIDPVSGSRSGDGSEAHPWLTLEQVIEDGLIQWYQHAERNNPDSELVVVNEGAPVRGGDRLLLKSGYHGHVALNTFIFTDWLTIAALDGHTPVLSQIRLQGAFAKIYLKGLTIFKDSYDGPGNYWEADEITHNSDAGLYLCSDNYWGIGRQVKVNNLTVATTLDTSAWTAAQWVERAASGIVLRSTLDCEIINCHIENIRFGLNITYTSDNTIAVNNTIKYYSGDGCRLIGNNSFLAYNTITDCLKVDDNHDDAIQSYSRGENNVVGAGVLSNNVVRGNLIIGTTDFTHPLAGNPQGMGCFAGIYDGWIVENNVVIVDHYHGISFYGMRNSYILNNTVIDQNYDNDTSPWIRITDYNGTPSENCTIANNIVYRGFSGISASGTNISEHNNYVVEHDNASLLYNLFVSPDDLNFHLQDNALTREYIIDQGETFADRISSQMDRDQTERTSAPDLGAYENEE